MALNEIKIDKEMMTEREFPSIELDEASLKIPSDMLLVDKLNDKTISSVETNQSLAKILIVEDDPF